MPRDAVDCAHAELQPDEVDGTLLLSGTEHYSTLLEPATEHWGLVESRHRSRSLSALRSSDPRRLRRAPQWTCAATAIAREVVKMPVNPDAENADLRAWTCLDGWAQSLPNRPVFDGIDYTHLVKWYLWDKVGECIRAGDPGGSAALGNLEAPSSFLSDCVQAIRLLGSATIKEARAQRSQENAGLFGRPAVPMGNRAGAPADPLVLAPMPTQRIAASIQILKDARVLVATSGMGWKTNDHGSARMIPRTFMLRMKRAVRSVRLSRNICSCLASRGLVLQLTSRRRLLDQLFKQQQIIAQAESAIDTARPNAILLHGDNHSPYQEFAAVARNRGIPSIAFQHGLDCERFYLDRIHASHYAVWSEAKYQLHRAADPECPAHLEITGNPAYDGLNYPTLISDTGSYWLWLSRPHAQKFCYAPSRRPSEGVEIFQALTRALQKFPNEQLIIKPHPNDYVDVYRALAADSDCRDRITISDEPPAALVPLAKLVVSEDTTAGVEAMFSGKIVIHAHFADSQPVLRLTDFGAALPGFSSDQLLDSIHEAQAMSPSAKSRMLDGQVACLEHYAGRLDGKAGQRFREFLLSAIRPH